MASKKRNMKLKGRLKFLWFMIVTGCSKSSGVYPGRALRTRPYLLYPFLFWDYSIAAAL